MAEGPIPSDGSDVYLSGEESITSATSDQPLSSASHGSRLSTSAEMLSDCIEAIDDLGLTDSSEYLIEPRIDMQDSDEAFNLDVAGDSDSNVGLISDEEEEEDINIPSPGDFASLLKESHFRLICDGSNTVFIEAMVLIFQFVLK